MNADDKIAEIHEFCDKHVKLAIENEGTPPPCRSGCFFCCKEPVYAADVEVRRMLAAMTPEQIADLKPKIEDWHNRFMATGLYKEEEPSVFPYRAAKMWCPLLINGLCSVYDRRPEACRLHVAYKTSEGCENDELRKDQKFAIFQDLPQALNSMLWSALSDGESVTYDHLGILLYEALFGKTEITGSRLTITAQGEDLKLEKYDHIDVLL